MSKDTLEVGDVWVEGIYKYHVTAVVTFEDMTSTVAYIGNRLYESYKSIEEFLKDFTYLGKSKANINDLFKTENEE